MDRRADTDKAAKRESKIGEGPVFEGAKPKAEYMKFIDLRDSGKLPPGETWNTWKQRGAQEREEIIQGRKEPEAAHVEDSKYEVS